MLADKCTHQFIDVMLICVVHCCVIVVHHVDHVIARKLSAAAAARTSAQGRLQSPAHNRDSTAANADIRDSMVLVCHGLLWRRTGYAEFCMSFQGILSVFIWLIYSPVWGQGTPFFLVRSLPHLLGFLLFPSSFSYSLYLFSLFCPSLPFLPE